MNLDRIEDFLKEENIALAGISMKKSKFGNYIYKELQAKGKNIFPLHHEMETYEGQKCYNNLDDLPENVNALIICTRPENSEVLLKQAVEKGIKNIWLQQGAWKNKELPDNYSMNSNIINGHCIMMFTNGKGIHAFHAFLLKLFGKYPK